jgi:hypothetical protein
MRKIFVFGVLGIALFTKPAMAQFNDQIFKPDFSYNWDQTDKVNLYVKSRFFFSIINLDNDEAIEYLEAGFGGSHKTQSTLTVGVFYLIRSTSTLQTLQNIEHRITEEFKFKSSLSSYSLSHRIRTEQRFRSAAYENRWRYRIGTTKALKGNNFLAFDEELISSFNREDFKAENRIYAGIGTKIGSRKMEIGLQYRLKNLLNEKALSHIIVLSTNVAFSR